MAGYDLLVRDGTAGDWQVWQHGLPGTSSEFAGSPGHTYYFRTQARDLAGHLEPWQPSPQAVTTLYTHVLSGTVTDLRGHVGMVPSLDLEPATAHFPPDPLSGVYRVYLGEEPGYTLAVSATGYGALPTTALDMAQDSRLDLVLPPQDEAVANGAFEAGSLDGWAVSGEGAQAAAVSRHTGAFGLHIAHAAAASTVLSQAVSLSEALHRPTISLMVRIPSDLEAGEFSVQVTGPLSATLFQASEATPGWVHVWADLSPAAGQVVTVTLKLSDAVGLAEVDEVSIGSWQTPLIEGISPADWSCGQVPLLSIAGQNLVATPTVYLGGAELADVTWVSSSLLTAGAPPALPPGRYDLVVANPNGSATTMPGAVTVTCHSVFLPLAVRDGPRLSSPPGAAWPTLGHDVKHTGRSDTDPGASRYALTWAATLPFPSLKELRSIAVADGVLVASDDGREGAAVVALDAGTGSELWRLPLWDKYSVNPPSIAHSAVYFQKGHSYNDSYLFCLDLYSGEQYWQAPFMVQWDDHQAPLVVDDAVFIQAGYYGGMYGFDAASGQELWYTGLPQYDNWAPAYADGTLYTWVAGFFRAHSPATGEILWTLDIGGSWHHYAMNTAPVIAGRTAVVVSAVALNAVDLDTRTVRWTVSGDYDSTIPAAADGVVYALRAGTLEARSLANGSLLWSFSGDQALANAPLVAGQYVYAASGAHTYVIDRTTHALMWQADHGGWLAVADGFLYIGQPDMTVYAYRAQEP